MKKTLITAGFFTLAFCAFAQTPAAELNFYAAQAKGDDTKLLLAIADNLSAWQDKNSALPYADEALYLKTDVLTRADAKPEAALTLLRYVYEFPTGKKIQEVKTALPAAAEKLHKEKRADYLKAAKVKHEQESSAVRMADFLSTATALNLKDSYRPLLAEYTSFFSRFPVYEESDKMELMLGDLHRQNKNYQAALMQYKKVYDIYPSTKYKAASLRMVGDVYAGDLKDYVTAMEYYQRVLKEFPTTVERAATYNHMAILSDSRKDYDNAVTYAAKAGEIYLENNRTNEAYEVLRYKADIQENRLKNYTAAVDTLKNIAKTFQKEQEKFIDTSFEIARVNGKRLKDPYGELSAYQDVFLYYPSAQRAPQAMYEAGQISEKIGEDAKAMDVYQKLIIAHPADSLATKAQRRLNALEKKAAKAQQE